MAITPFSSVPSSPASCDHHRRRASTPTGALKCQRKTVRGRGRGKERRGKGDYKIKKRIRDKWKAIQTKELLPQDTDWEWLRKGSRRRLPTSSSCLYRLVLFVFCWPQQQTGHTKRGRARDTKRTRDGDGDLERLGDTRCGSSLVLPLFSSLLSGNSIKFSISAWLTHDMLWY